LNVNKRDFITSVVLLIVAALAWRESYKIPKLVFTDNVGSAFFPRIVITLIAIMSVILMIGSFRAKPRTSTEREPKGRTRDLLIRVAVFGLLIAYVALLPKLGYTWATMGFLVLLMLLLGPVTLKSVLTMVVVTICTTLGIEYVFGTLLRVFLP
jgi:putative tricarboxylic transport membrane protein